jgi:hypothetical protein
MATMMRTRRLLRSSVIGPATVEGLQSSPFFKLQPDAERYHNEAAAAGG